MNNIIKKVQIASFFIFVMLIGKNSLDAQTLPMISSIDPNYAASAGGTLTIKGTAILPNSFKARIGDIQLQVISSTSTEVTVKLPTQSITGNLYVSNGTPQTEYPFCINYRVIKPQIASMELSSLASGSILPTDGYRFGDEVKLTGKDLDFLVLGREIEGIGTAIKFANVYASSVNLTEIPYPTRVVNNRIVNPYPDNRYYYIGIQDPVINSDKTELTFTLGEMFEYKTPSDYVGSGGILYPGAPGRNLAGLETYFTYGAFLEMNQVNMNGQLAFRCWEVAGNGKLLPSPSEDEIVNFSVHTGTFSFLGLPPLQVTKLYGREGYTWEISRPNMGIADNHPYLADVKFWVEGEGFSTRALDEKLKLFINDVEHPITVDPGGKTASFILKQDAGTVNVKFVRGNERVTHLSKISKPILLNMPIRGTRVYQPTAFAVFQKPTANRVLQPTTANRVLQPTIANRVMQPTIASRLVQPGLVLQQSLTATVIPTPWFPPNTNPTVTIGSEHTLVGNYLLPPTNIGVLSYKIVLDSPNYEANIIQHTNNMIRFSVIKSAGGSDHPGNYYLEIFAVYPNGVERVIKGVWVDVQHL